MDSTLPVCINLPILDISYMWNLLQYLLFCVGLISLGIMFSNYVCVGACGISFLFMVELYSIAIVHT